MKQSKLFPLTKKTTPKDATSVNHKYLVRGGFIDQLMAGSWTLLPLGFRVVSKINSVIREEMNAIGAQEMLMPLLHPKEIWNETGRWEKAKDVMYQFKDSRGKEFALSFTHEEIVMDLLRKHTKSYQDFPYYVYHFSTKFRNELRPRSGILRGREFMMKDLYSAHTTKEDMNSYYEIVSKAYEKIFKRLGFDIKVVEAAGGVFTDENTHEFQVVATGGEDTIYFCDKCSWAQNIEIYQGKEGDPCPSCIRGKIKSAKSIELGNIFKLGTWYSEGMKAYYVDKEGKKKLIWFASYGIGPTRTMGAWVEISHDEKGVIWNRAMSPFDVHLISLPGANEANKVYSFLKDEGV